MCIKCKREWGGGENELKVSETKKKKKMKKTVRKE